MPDDTARFAPADMVSWNDAAGEELALFDGDSGGYFALNGAAVAIWRGLAAGHSVDEIIDMLAARFDSPRSAIAEDVAAFVRNALDRRLIIARQ